MRRARLLAVVGAAVFINGCGCVGREFTFDRDFSVHAESAEALCQTDRFEVNLGADQAFANVKQYIGTLELRRLMVTVVNPKTRADSVARAASGTVRIDDPARSRVLDLGTYGNVPLVAGASQEIPFDKTAARTLARLALESPNTFTVEAEGCSDANPAFYDFRVELTIFAGL